MGSVRDIPKISSTETFLGRCQSTSSHGTRCCFAQPANQLCLLLECGLNIWIQLKPSELACLPQELRSHNDAQDLLLLQDYVCKLSHAQQTLEATCASLQQTELLAGVIHEQDCRAIRTACCCLNSLRIRVEARANVTERAGISRQLQLMQASVQPRPTEDLNTADKSCPPRTSAEHFDDKTGPCPKN